MRVVIQNVGEGPCTIGRDLTADQLAFLREIAEALNAEVVNYEPELRIYAEGEVGFADYEYLFAPVPGCPPKADTVDG